MGGFREWFQLQSQRRSFVIETVSRSTRRRHAELEDTSVSNLNCLRRSTTRRFSLEEVDFDFPSLRIPRKAAKESSYKSISTFMQKKLLQLSLCFISLEKFKEKGFSSIFFYSFSFFCSKLIKSFFIAKMLAVGIFCATFQQKKNRSVIDYIRGVWERKCYSNVSK